MRTAIAVFIFMLCSVYGQSTCGQSATYYVPDQFATIQDAIADVSVVNGDTIVVRPDTVNGGPYMEMIDFVGKAITLKSEFGPEQTTLCGDLTNHVVTFNNGEGPGSVLDGFTITNGAEGEGGGIFCDATSPTIINNHVVGNTAFRCGGIYCRSSSSLISNNVIAENDAVNGGGMGFDDCNCEVISNTVHSNFSSFLGGGILCENGTVQITGNVIYGNQTQRYGGGITCTDDATVIQDNIIFNNSVEIYGGGVHLGSRSFAMLRNNIIYGNKAYIFGGGVFCRRGSPVIERNIISGNWSATNGGGIYLTLCSPEPVQVINNTVVKNHAEGEGGGIYCQESSLPVVLNTIVWSNTAQSLDQIGIEGNEIADITYCAVEGGWDGAGNIDSDPLFIDLSDDDYRLSWLSPCINRGKGDGNMGTVDMGALEFLGTHALECDGFEIPAQGGTVQFSLDAGPDSACGDYVIVTGISGTAPGFTLTDGSTIVPLNWDPVTDLMFALMGTAICQDFMGTLDEWGKATAAFNCPPLPGYVDTRFYMAFGMDNPWYFASNPVELVLVP